MDPPYTYILYGPLKYLYYTHIIPPYLDSEKDVQAPCHPISFPNLAPLSHSHSHAQRRRRPPHTRRWTMCKGDIRVSGSDE